MVAKPKKPTRPGPRRAFADDLEVVVDGESFFPHMSEWVDFRGGNQTVGDFLSSLEIKGTDLGEAAVDDEASRLAGLTFSAWIETIKDSIVGWNWTDATGKPFPSPPSVSDLRRLDFDELSWLRAGGRNKESPLVAG